MTTLLDLSKTMKSQKARIVALGNEAKKKVALAIAVDLITVTPVDSSQALSNWQVALQTPIGKRIDAYFYGSHGSTQELSGASAMAKARSIIALAKPGQVIFISNVLPYIQRLNEGYSGQAPAGFVERSVLIGRAALR
jgi:hypothetical protein